MRQAAATYSVVAVDTATRQVGGAGASCLSGADVFIIYGSVPGRGVLVAQALPGNRDRAVELMTQGASPEELIATIIASETQTSLLRQYGVVDLEGRVAAHTGTATSAYSGDRQGRSRSFVYSVQGNILTGEAVLTQAADAFEGGGCDLAERLMLALEAGAAGGGGDNRCTPDGIPADSAFLQVDREGEPAGSYLSLRVPTSGSANPLVELRASFDAWREANPCPAGSGGSGRGSAPAAEDGGCGCRTAPRGSAGLSAFWGILAFGLTVSRRWNRGAHRC